jgi:hypothetical protein
LVTELQLTPKHHAGGQAKHFDDNTWRLEITSGPGGHYRLAQLDDYTSLRRDAFPWRPPISVSLRARASAAAIPGTWGFGLWNDPFSFSMGFGGGERRVPVLPNAAWFFFASPQNYLSLCDDLPATGNLAATFRSRRYPALLLALGAPLLPLIALPPLVRLFRRLGRRYIHQDSIELSLDVTSWQVYQLDWTAGDVRFLLGGKTILHSRISPYGPLGLVLWVDNQYAALPPDGRLGYGTLPNPQPAWIEIADLSINSLST